MNLEITSNAESVFIACAKTNKNVPSSQGKNLPWYAIFEIKGEQIDVATVFPSEPTEITVENWAEKVWEPLVETVTTNYAKNACMAVVEVLYVNAEGNTRSEPIFFKWCPDTGVPVRAKMLIGSSFQSAKKKLDVQGTTPEVSQRSQLDLNTFAEIAKLKGFVPV